MTLTSPVQITASQGRAVSVLCAAPGAEGNAIQVWPWQFPPQQPLPHTVEASKGYFGTPSTPCFTLLHPSTIEPSVMSSIQALPLHVALLQRGIAPPVPAVWSPYAAPFLQVLASAVLLQSVVLESFGVFIPAGEAPLEGLQPQRLAAVELRGGAIGLYDATATLQSVEITHCKATEGGALFALGGEVTLSDATFTHNAAAHRGGGVSIYGSIPRISASNLSANAVAGAALWWRDNAVALAAEVGGGGAVFCFGVLANELIITGTALHGNAVYSGRSNARDVGGAVAASFCNVVMTATSLGANAVGSSNVTALLTGAAAAAAAPHMNGGGLFASRSTVAMEGCEVLGNAAGGSGGGVAVEETGVAVMERCGFRGNAAARGAGGGLLIDASFDVTMLRHCNFTGNVAHTSHGGAVALVNAPQVALASKFIGFSVAFTGNKAKEGGGGAVYVEELQGVQSLLQEEGGGITLLDNDGGYGDDVATDPRKLVLFYSPPLSLSFSESFQADTMVAAALDDFNHTVTTLSEVVGKVVYVAIHDDEGRNVTLPDASPYNVRFFNGKAAFTGMAFPVRPGYSVTARIELALSSRTLLSELFTVQLLPCPNGYYLPASNPTTCLACTPGRFKLSRQAEQCPSCSALEECSSCPAGAFSAEAAALSCTLCSPGTTVSSPGSTKCSPCQDGFFSGLGWSRCLPCPRNGRCNNGRLGFQPGWWANAATFLHEALPLDAEVALLRAETVAAGRAMEEGNSKEGGAGGGGGQGPPMCHVAVLNGNAGALNVTMLPGLGLDPVDVYGFTDQLQVAPCLSGEACITACDGAFMTCAEGHSG